MKYIIILTYFFIFNFNISYGQNDTCETCVEYSLEVFSNKLQGSSLQFPGYDVSMILPSNFLKNELSIKNLKAIIDTQDIRGEFIFPNGKTTEIKYSIVPYKDSTTIFMKTSNGWYPWDKMRIKQNKLIFSYDYWYYPPATKTDLEILDLCLHFLNDSTHWNHNDDRACDDDRNNSCMSLFCALKIASIEIMKEYNHRNTAIQTVRLVIDDLVPNHQFEHTIKDYNNLPTTKYNDVLNVLKLAKERINKELLQQNK
jgi:hypothetical protein